MILVNGASYKEQQQYGTDWVKAELKKKNKTEKSLSFSYLHLGDHVVRDFILPELSGNQTVTVALRHSTCPTWHGREISVEGQKKR